MVSAGHLGARLALCLAIGVPGLASAHIRDDSCTDLRAEPQPVSDRRRPLKPEDLVTLTDIGDPAPLFDSGGLSLSPDGRYLAFPIRRANPVTNDYCLGIVRIDLQGVSAPVFLDRSGELVRGDFDLLGTLLPLDYPAFVRPKWSPDGRWVAFEKSVRGQIMLWRAHTDGSGSEAIAGTDGNLQEFRWLDNNSMLVAVRPATMEAQEAIRAEGRSGYRYDARFLPSLSDHPFPLTPRALLYRVVTISTGATRPASEQEQSPSRIGPEGSLRAARGLGGDVAWATKAYPDRYGPDSKLSVAFRGHPTLQCGPERCNRVEGLWWVRAAHGLVFVHREGWANSRTGISIWRRGEPAPRTVLTTEDMLVDCQPNRETLICGQEGSRQPRRIVQISLKTGGIRTLYDPNPAFSSSLELGRTERLHWLNANGIETYGDLVYPVNYRPGTRYPTIVTTYTTRGFLRGATGDEYPIQLFANHGFAVLSFARPLDVGVNVAGVPDALSQHRVANRGWADRRSVQSALEEGLKLLEKKGVADKAKIGITGLSDGATTAQFALVNSQLFAAAVVSHCCFEPYSILSDSGLRTGDYFRSDGFTALDDLQSFPWSAMSLVSNARSIQTPLLMELGSDEFRWALSGFTTLREHEKPVDMYVFPDEGHIKLQPAHRLAIYRRNVAWFDFWLQGREDHDLAESEELERWRALRSAQIGSR